MDGAKLVMVAVLTTACGGGSPPAVTAPAQDVVVTPAASTAPTSSSPPPPPPQTDPVDDGSGSLGEGRRRLPQSDPMPSSPAPRCPSVAALAKATAVVRRESAARTRAPASASVLDIELTVTLPANPKTVTFVPDHLTVAGGVIVQQKVDPQDHVKAVVLIRAATMMTREGTMFALFGVGCTGAEGNLRVDMTYAIPLHDGDAVKVTRLEGY